MRALSRREVQVLRLTADGLAMKEIAVALRLAPETVNSCRRRIRAALQARNTTHAVAIALTKGLLYEDRPPARPAEKISPGQNRALHAKSNDLDKLEQSERGTARRRALDAAASHFGRRLESSSDLTEIEASWTLDWLEEALAVAKAATNEGGTE